MWSDHLQGMLGKQVLQGRKLSTGQLSFYPVLGFLTLSNSPPRMGHRASPAQLPKIMERRRGGDKVT